MSLVESLRIKSKESRERMDKEEKGKREAALETGYKDLLGKINAAAESGKFTHIFKGSKEICENYSRRLTYEGFHIRLNNAGGSYHESDEPVFYLTIDWSEPEYYRGD